MAKANVVLVQIDPDSSVVIPGNSQPVSLIVFELLQLDVVAANFANNSFVLSILPRSFALAASILTRPFFNSSGRVNHFVVLASPVLASLEQFKGNLFAPLASLEGLLINITSWQVLLHQFEDFFLRGGPLRRLLFLDVLLLGLSRPILRDAEPWWLLLLVDAVRRDVFLYQVVIIGLVKFFFRQFSEVAKAKGVYRVVAAVILWPVSSSDRVEGYFDLL